MIVGRFGVEFCKRWVGLPVLHEKFVDIEILKSGLGLALASHVPSSCAVWCERLHRTVRELHFVTQGVRPVCDFLSDSGSQAVV